MLPDLDAGVYNPSEGCFQPSTDSVVQHPDQVGRRLLELRVGQDVVDLLAVRMAKLSGKNRLSGN